MIKCITMQTVNTQQNAMPFDLNCSIMKDAWDFFVANFWYWNYVPVAWSVKITYSLCDVCQITFQGCDGGGSDDGCLFQKSQTQFVATWFDDDDDCSVQRHTLIWNTGHNLPIWMDSEWIFFCSFFTSFFCTLNYLKNPSVWKSTCADLANCMHLCNAIIFSGEYFLINISRSREKKQNIIEWNFFFIFFFSCSTQLQHNFPLFAPYSLAIFSKSQFIYSVLT